MTDYNVRKRNPLTGFALKMHVKNAEKFGPEVHQLFKDLEHATEFPKQASLDDFEGRRMIPNPCPICASKDITTRMLRKASSGVRACYAVECESCGYIIKSQCLEWAIDRWNKKY